MSFWRAAPLLLGLVGCVGSREDAGATTADLESQRVCGLDPSLPSSPRALLATKFTDTLDAETRLVCLTTMLDAQHDHRAPFAALYTNTTKEVRKGIAAGRFDDAVYGSDLLTEFAELYRVGFVGYVDRAPIAGAWQVAFDAAKASDDAHAQGRPDDVLSLQHVALGVNAHVNHDLAHAVATVTLEGGALASRKHDYDVVRSILEEIVTASFDLVIADYAPKLGMTPAALRAALADVFLVWLLAGREKAWLDGLLLLEGGLLASITAASVEFTSKEMAKGILLGNGLAPDLFAALKKLEGGS